MYRNMKNITLSKNQITGGRNGPCHPPKKSVVAKAETVLLHFQWTELLQGKLQAVDIKSITITSGHGEENSLDTPYEFPLLQQWLQAFTLQRITIDEGVIDDQIQIDNVDLQKIDGALVLDSHFIVANQTLRIQGAIEPNDSFHISAIANNNQFTFYCI